MPVGMKNIVRVGLETTRGTAVATALTAPFLADGLRIDAENHLAIIESSSRWPDMVDAVSLGLSPSVAFAPDIHVNSIRDMLEFCWFRTYAPDTIDHGNLVSLTLEENAVYQGARRATGVICRSMEMRFERGETPDESAILSMSIEALAMTIERPLSVIDGVQSVGRRFQIAQSTFGIAPVGDALIDLGEVTAWRWALTNTLYVGPHNDNRQIMYIEEGRVENEFELTQRFLTAVDQRAYVEDGEEVEAEFVISTGVAGETVTLTIDKAQVANAMREGAEGTQMQRFTLRPFFDSSIGVPGGTDRAVRVVFGAGIGGGVLNIA